MRMEKDWIEIGSLLSGIRFQISVNRDGTRKVGYRVRPSMTHTTNSDYLCKLVGRERIPSKGIYRKGSDLEKCLPFIEKICNTYECWELLYDRKGYDNIRWVLDNPPPSDWGDFIEWSKQFDLAVF